MPARSLFSLPAWQVVAGSRLWKRAQLPAVAPVVEIAALRPWETGEHYRKAFGLQAWVCRTNLVPLAPEMYCIVDPASKLPAG